MTRFRLALAALFLTVIAILASRNVQAQITPPPVPVQVRSTTLSATLFLPLVVNRYLSPLPTLNKIVYSSGYTSANKISNIYVMTQDGTGQTQLTSQTGSRYLKPSWSPDGARIAFYSATTISNETMSQVYVMTANGSAITPLVSVPGHHFHPTWSPYGDKIAFSSDLYKPGPYPNHIYVMNADGSGSPNNLTNSSAHDFWPDWSPDGKKIAYVSVPYSGSGNTQIYVMNADGSGQVNVSHSAYDDNGPNWSPDSSKIAFYRNLGSSSSPNVQIFVMNADGSGQTQITFSGQNFYPNWSPDGARLTFQRYYTNYADIYTMDANGVGITDITNHQSSFASMQPDWR